MKAIHTYARNYLLGLGLVLFPSFSFAETIDITRVSVATNNLQGNARSTEASVSEDGRYVVFSSAASNLDSGDTNNVTDVFLRDRQTSATTRISLTSSTQGDGASSGPFISANGRFVVFESLSTNLVAGDSNAKSDVFVLDRNDASVSRVSLSTTASSGDGDSTSGSISNDGRFVVYASSATNLIPGDTNSVADVFLYDRDNPSTSPVRVSETTALGQGNAASSAPTISKDGAWVAFASRASNLSTGDTNLLSDVFIYERATLAITRVSPSLGGLQGDGISSSPSISADGRYIAYESISTNLVASDTNAKSDVFVYDRVASPATLTRVSVGVDATQSNGNSVSPAISGDGRYVSFLSDATNLVLGDTNNTAGDGIFDAFIYDTQTNTTKRLDIGINGAQVTGTTTGIAISGAGSVVAFESDSSALVTGDTNAVADVFVTDSACPTDSDSDGSVNCQDSCPLDPAKIALGICGCDVADSDTDNDATLDCNDVCPSDPAKTLAGVCGCGISDQDTNGNGDADCLDAKKSTIPQRVQLLRKSGNLIIRIPKKFRGVSYEVQLKSGRSIVSRFRTRSHSITVNRLRRGKYSVIYRIKSGSVLTRYSSPTSINF